MNLDRLLWHVRRHAPVWLPRLSVALLLLVGVVWLTVLLPLEQRVDAAEQGQRAQRDGLLKSASADRGGDPQERLARFYAFFEGSDALPGKLERLYTTARAAGLELSRAEYRLSTQGDQKLARYQIVLPVVGSYRSIRSFAAQALEAVPALALTQIKFQRRRISEGAAEAQIIFTLYLKR